MKNLKNILKSVAVITALLSVVSGATLSAFTASATVQGNTFSVGSAALRLWSDLDGGPDVQVLENTVDFLNIYPGWKGDYFAKVSNTGSVPLKLSVAASPVVPDSLATQITVEVYSWVDQNSDGVAQLGELSTTTVATGTLASWEASPFDLSAAVAAFQGDLDTDLDASETVGLHFVFRAPADLSDSYQGHSTTYDFVFNGTTAGTNP